jgi:hypothetical protein
MTWHNLTSLLAVQQQYVQLMRLGQLTTGLIHLLAASSCVLVADTLVADS